MRQGIIFLLIFFSTIVSAQDNKKYFDAFGLQGEVFSRGVFSDTILPSKGNFEIRWREINGNDLNTYNIKGFLDAHLPQGRWKWEEASWVYTIEPGADISPMFNSAGERKSWDANFLKGKAHGAWSFTQDSVHTLSKNPPGALKINARFSNGRITGKFTIQDDRPEHYFFLSGNCDNDGIATGTWIYRFRETRDGEIIREERKYEKGLLLEVKTQRGDSVHIKDLRPLQTHIHPFRVGEDLFSEDGNKGISQELQRKYIEELFFSGWSMEIFPYNFERTGPYFRKIQYPISEEEQRYITLTDSLVELLAPEVEKRLAYRNILLHRGRTGELDLALSYTKASQQRLLVVDSLLKRTSLPNFTYKNRFDQGLSKWLELINQPNMVKGVSFEADSINLPLVDLSNNSGNVFEQMHGMLVELYENLPAQLKIIDDSFLQFQIEGELQNLEDLISERISLADSLYKPLSGTGAAMRSRWVEVYLRQKLQEYSQLDDYEMMKKSGREILSKTDSLISWAPEWAVFDEMLKQLEEQYSHFVYNPYTGKHDIEVKIKKRFFNSVSGVYWPWLGNKLTEAGDWEQFVNYWELVRQSYVHLFEFAKMDSRSSKRFDKKFRKEKQPAKMAKMLLNYMSNH